LRLVIKTEFLKLLIFVHRFEKNGEPGSSDPGKGCQNPWDSWGYSREKRTGKISILNSPARSGNAPKDWNFILASIMM